jgi:hypothetical protein
MRCRSAWDKELSDADDDDGITEGFLRILLVVFV